jgi:hypothetical protein
VISKETGDGEIAILGGGLTERQKIALQLFFCMQLSTCTCKKSMLQLQVESCIEQKSCT